MSGYIFPILIAAIVALVVFAVAQVVAALTNGEKRRLQSRLSGDHKHSADGQTGPRSITHDIKEVTGLSHVLMKTGLLGGLHRKLIQAYPDTSLARFLGLAAGLGAVMFLLIFCVSGFNTIVGAVAGGIGAYVPFLALSSKRSKRQRMMADQLPEALDFLSRILRAGHSLSTGLQMMADELPKPLAGEFRRCYDQHSLGQSMEDSLKDMAGRIDSTDFAFFVTAVLIQRQTGGDLSEVLNNISGMIRQRIRLQNHVKAKTAERFTGYILVAFPAVMFVLAYVLNPAYAGVLTKTSTGLMLLGIAFGLQMLGLYAIRKITTVRV